MSHHFRIHELSIWLNLIPKLHLAGADNLFPQHNTFAGNDDPNLFTGVIRPPRPFSHGYQVNREFFGTTGSPPVTTCIPLSAAGAAASIGSSNGGLNRDQSADSSLVRLENANLAYHQVMYLTVGVGAILLAVSMAAIISENLISLWLSFLADQRLVPDLLHILSIKDREMLRSGNRHSFKHIQSAK